MTGPPPKADFDPIGRPYRWLEYLTLGHALERCRNHFLPTLSDRRCAIVLGDGDGRFLSRLLAANRQLRADAVDTSAVMLQLLTHRAGESAARIRTHHVDALRFMPSCTYDLIVTHFVVDCLTQSDLNTLALSMARHAAPDALWLLSDFRIPSGPMHWSARILVRLLYFAFRLITGLRTTALPDHAAALSAAGFTLTASHHSMSGILTSEIWTLSRIRRA